MSKAEGCSRHGCEVHGPVAPATWSGHMLSVFIIKRLSDVAEITPSLAFTFAVMAGVAKGLIYLAG